MEYRSSYRLPYAFIRDCEECDCDVGDYDNGKLFATSVQLAELRDRASYYASPNGPDATDDGGVLKRAAIALLKSMDKQAI